jgi:hypothetical protein
MQTRHLAMLDSYRLSGPVAAAQDALEDALERIDEIDEVVSAAADPPVDVPEAADSLRGLVAELEDELDDAGEGASAWERIEGYTGPATADQLWQIERSWERVPPVIERINELVTGRLAALTAKVYAAAVRPPPGDEVPMPDRRR